MTHYLDLGFLLCLVAKAPGTAAAWAAVRRLPQPLPLTALQVENGLRQRKLGVDPKLQAVAARAWGLWQFYLHERVFVLAPAPWDAALALARSWNERTPKEPPTSSFLMHPAIAASCGCTHFLSFQPESRTLAAAAGLTLLPAKLYSKSCRTPSCTRRRSRRSAGPLTSCPQAV